MAVRLTVLVAGLLLLSGCMWLRLSTVKDQLADLDRYIEVPDGERLELRFKERPLRAGDPEDVIGAPPSTAAALADGTQQLTWRFRRVALDGQVVPETGWILDFDVWTKDGRVTAVAFPAQVYRVMDRERCITMLRAFGQGEVDTSKREVEAQVQVHEPGIATASGAASASAVWLQRAAMLECLGAPFTSIVAEQQLRDTYRYRLDGTPTAEARLLLEYDESGSRLQRMRVTINKIWLSVRF